jgi:hypothetical protein
MLRGYTRSAPRLRSYSTGAQAPPRKQISFEKLNKNNSKNLYQDPDAAAALPMASSALRGLFACYPLPNQQFKQLDMV